MKNAIIIAAEGVQDVELIYPYYRLQEAGYTVRVCAPGAKPFVGIKGVPFKADMDFDDLFSLTEPVNLLILPGGVKAMEKLRLQRQVLDFIRTFHLNGGVIGCICSGAQLLISAKIVSGKQISAYYAMKDDVENAGAVFIDAPSVVWDRVVTSPHYEYLGPWMAAVLAEVKEAAK